MCIRDRFKFKRSDDIMTYLAIRPECRSVNFVSVMLVAVGWVLLIYSLHETRISLCVLSMCLLMPVSSSIISKMPLVAYLPVRADSIVEKVDWPLEIATLALSLTCLLLLDSWIPADQYLKSVALPIAASISIGSGLGLYR